jgi:NADH:ubiquinone oxidoreductase subunit 3 (subunit A)
MYIIPIVIYCLVAALFIFGLTFHDELLREKQSKNKKRSPASLVVIDGGRRRLAKPHQCS